ncbi:MAG TPA: sugar ABC transporter permease [Chloroflexota bacterium]|jgi:multiple sugar transport system permease protein|nr:sugar ABC transporter permease [Chloroflexota bacterium]
MAAASTADVRRRRRFDPAGYFFLLPSLLAFATFIVFPVLASFYLAFTRYDILTPPRFIGLRNFEFMLTGDPLFWKVLGNTLYYSIVQVPLNIVCALGLALALNQKLRGVVIYRSLYFIPVVSSIIAVAIVWRWVYDADWGILNWLISYLGIPKQNWLFDPVLAMPSVILMNVWKSMGYNMVLFLAGLQGIPEVYYEAAKIDGARGWHLFRHITLPLLSPVMFFVVVISIINSFQVFGAIYIMTKGGPLDATNVLVYHLYFKGFNELQMGYAAALAWVLFSFLFVITMIQTRLSKGWVHYGH